MNVPTEGRAARRKDKAWLLWDLRTRRRDMEVMVPAKSGIVLDITRENLAHFDRLIDLVKEIRP